jgi:hypothetical protein
MRVRWHHFAGGLFSSAIIVVLVIASLALPPDCDEREAAAWALSAVASFVLGMWFLLNRWLRRRHRRALERAARAAASPAVEPQTTGADSAARY